jgi:mercuric ion transport protein
MAFPNYSSVFFPKQQSKQVIIVDKSNIQEVKLTLEGMYCEACAHTINEALTKEPGVLDSKTSYTESMSIVKMKRVRHLLRRLKKL